MPEADAERLLFGETLAVEGLARLALVTGPLPDGALDDAERVLREIATVEDRRGDEGDSATPGDPALRRLEAKLDLTLHLLAHALPGLRGPSPVPARMSARGVHWLADDPGRILPPSPDPAAVLRWQPADWLPLSVHLPVRRLDDEAWRWWAFEALGPALDDALERHIFRMHRRWRASQRPG